MKPKLVGITSDDMNQSYEMEGHHFFNTPPDYDFYAKQDLWEPWEAVCLLLELEPNTQLTDDCYHDWVGRKIQDWGQQEPKAIAYTQCYATMQRSRLTAMPPKSWLEWAVNKGFSIPGKLRSAVAMYAAIPDQRPSYATQEMQLIYAAVDKFWSEYDLSKPNPHIVPKKSEVVTWLLAEAHRRGHNLSQTLADKMDTIIRCPTSRKGGQTL